MKLSKRHKAFEQQGSLEPHSNRVRFWGLLTKVDQLSDKAPSGARGHRVLLTRHAVETALPTLLGMAVDFKAGWDGHDARQKVGVITEAWIERNDVLVRGYAYCRDFPELETATLEQSLGMSYELADAHVADMRAQTWVLTKFTFTGAAILQSEHAAYRSTRFLLNSVSFPAVPEQTFLETRIQRFIEQPSAERFLQECIDYRVRSLFAVDSGETL